MFGPRAGLAWDLFGNGKTAIRAGFGTYYSLIDSLSFLLNSLPPYNGSVSFSSVPLSSILPVVPGVTPPPACGPGVPKPCTTYAPQGVQANAQTPAVEEWNFAVEQQLSHDTALRVAYAGSHGYHGLLSIDANSIPAQICSSTGGCNSGGTPGTRKGTGIPAAVREYSDTLLIFMLKARNPAIFGDRVKQEHSGPADKPIPVIVLPALRQGPVEEQIMAVPEGRPKP